MRIKTKKIKNKLGKMILFIARHDFLICLFLIFLSLVFGFFLIYRYAILEQKVKPEVSVQNFQIKMDTYQEILDIWQKQEKISNEANSKEYSNPFKPVSGLTE